MEREEMRRGGGEGMEEKEEGISGRRGKEQKRSIV
jgi:hypothetical protein